MDECILEITPLKEILKFISELPITKALTDQHMAYLSHKAIRSFVPIGNEDKELLITEALIQRVLDFKDKDEDLTMYSERMCKGCYYRMGYKGFVNTVFNKAFLGRPYKFFVHSVISALSHRKRGVDALVNYQMCMIVALTLNKPYKFTGVIFEHMKANIEKEKFLQYPIFVKMMLDDQFPNLVKNKKKICWNWAICQNFP
ncbi:hypothetical protein Hanom_Chr16g01428121 [Helianthus anomalus]